MVRVSSGRPLGRASTSVPSRPLEKAFVGSSLAAGSGRLAAVLSVTFFAACGDTGSVKASSASVDESQQQISEEPVGDVATEDTPAPRTSLREGAALDAVSGPEDSPRFIPNYWLTFEPARLYLFAGSGQFGPRKERVTIRNKGRTDIRLRNIELTAGAGSALSEDGVRFFEIAVPDGKETLAAGEETVVEVIFHPNVESTVSANLVVLTDMPDRPMRVVPIVGRAFR